MRIPTDKKTFIFLSIFVFPNQIFCKAEPVKNPGRDNHLFQAAVKCILKNNSNPISEFIKPIQGEDILVNYKVYKKEDTKRPERDLEIVFMNKSKEKMVLYEVMPIGIGGKIKFRNYGFLLKKSDGEYLFNPRGDTPNELFESQGGVWTMDHLEKMIKDVMSSSGGVKIQWDEKSVISKSNGYPLTCP
jgi:hypothetical protein